MRTSTGVLKSFVALAFLAALFISAGFVSCSSDSDGGETSTTVSSITINGEHTVTTGFFITLTAVPNVATSSDYAWTITDGAGCVTSDSSKTDTITLQGVKAGTVTVKVSVDGVSSDAFTVNVQEASSAGNVISVSDIPVGYASIDTSKFANSVTVSAKTDLVKYAKKGGYVIYVKGMIDMSDGMLPSTAGGSTEKLDSFVAENTSKSYTSYTAFRDTYAKACSATTEDGDKDSSTKSSLYDTLWALNKAYGDKIKLSPASNTAIIGLDSSSGIKGGTIQISGNSNIVIRNLTIQDAYDPFPHHEKNDGFNAQWDGIAIKNSSNIWVDHCTIEDTMEYTTVKINGGSSEKWQTYDGLCDITNSSKNIVVSYNIFRNHDKTMLIGSSKSDISGGSVTIHHNKFLNCGQRLPMTTYPNMHIFNNYYMRNSDAYYKQQACIVGRYSAYTIIAENNCFGTGVKNCLTKSTDASGKCYSSGNKFEENSRNTYLVTSTSEKPFTPAYDYSSVLETADKVPADLEQNAGSGVWTVSK